MRSKSKAAAVLATSVLAAPSVASPFQLTDPQLSVGYGIRLDDGLSSGLDTSGERAGFAPPDTASADLELARVEGVVHPVAVWQGLVRLGQAGPIVLTGTGEFTGLDSQLTLSLVEVRLSGELARVPIDGTAIIEGSTPFELSVAGEFWFDGERRDFALEVAGFEGVFGRSLNGDVGAILLDFAGERTLDFGPAFERGELTFYPKVIVSWHTVVPEPSTALLFALGALGLALGSRRRHGV